MPKWLGRAILLSFWIFSAWYLYVGGLITETLNFSETLLAVFIANLIFVLIFTFYAGTKKNKDVLFQEAFGLNGARYFISLLPVLSQIGWYAVVIEIGGSATALALGLERGELLFHAMIVVYAFLTIWIARGGLSKISKLSYFSIPAMVGFSLWGAYAVIYQTGFTEIFSYQPISQNAHSIAYGVQLLIASFLSAAVTIPDFLHDLENKKKIFLASFWGLIPATLWVGGLGAVLAIVGKSFDVLQTLQIMSGPFFVYLLLSVDNLCGAQAIFPVGTGLASIHGDFQDEGLFEKRRRFWTLAGGLISIVLALVGIVGRLEIWLTILGTVFAPIIGVVLANQYIVKGNFSASKIRFSALSAWVLGLAVSFYSSGLPVLQALLASFIVFVFLEKINK